MTTHPLPLRSAPPAPAERRYPLQPLLHLDAVWIQVAGSRCNLTCTHCFVSCGPAADRHALMSRGEVAARVSEALALGCREFYLTGGEPFLHPELIDIVADTLEHAPCTVLTNGTLFTERRIAELARLSHATRHSFELRVSFDGEEAAEHDVVRGPGTFARTLEGLARCSAAGLLPIATVTQLADEEPLAFRERWIARLRAAGVERPRLKVLPLFRLGREADRTRGYQPAESLAGVANGFDVTRLQCGTSRAVTSRGVFVCPLLVDEDRARMGDTLAGTLHPFELSHGACFTCHVTGMTCGNG